MGLPWREMNRNRNGRRVRSDVVFAMVGLVSKEDFLDPRRSARASLFWRRGLYLETLRVEVILFSPNASVAGTASEAVCFRDAVLYIDASASSIPVFATGRSVAVLLRQQSGLATRFVSRRSASEYFVFATRSVAATLRRASLFRDAVLYLDAPRRVFLFRERERRGLCVEPVCLATRFVSPRSGRVFWFREGSVRGNSWRRSKSCLANAVLYLDAPPSKYSVSRRERSAVLSSSSLFGDAVLFSTPASEYSVFATRSVAVLSAVEAVVWPTRFVILDAPRRVTLFADASVAETKKILGGAGIDPLYRMRIAFRQDTSSRSVSMSSLPILTATTPHAFHIPAAKTHLLDTTDASLGHAPRFVVTRHSCEQSAAVYHGRAESFETMSDLPAKLRDELAESFDVFQRD